MGMSYLYNCMLKIDEVFGARQVIGHFRKCRYSDKFSTALEFIIIAVNISCFLSIVNHFLVFRK